MKYRATLVLWITFSMVKMIDLKQRKKRAHSDNFDVLLELYKMNPLRKSNIFQKFCHNILLPSRNTEAGDVRHFDSNESSREKQLRIGVNLKHIEEIIHATSLPELRVPFSDYTVKKSGPEMFSVKHVKLLKPKRNSESTVIQDDQAFKSIFEHIESNEIPNTKLIPRNVTAPKSRNPFIVPKIPTINKENEVTVKNDSVINDNKELSDVPNDDGVVIMR